jgi:hypothetical protein
MFYVSYAVGPKQQFQRDLFNGDHWQYLDAVIEQHPLLWLASQRSLQLGQAIRIVFWSQVDMEQCQKSC